MQEPVEVQEILLGTVSKNWGVHFKIAQLPKEQAEEFRKNLPQSFETDWEYIARPQQLEPEGDWSILLMLAGRGFGKTRASMEWILKEALTYPGEYAIIGKTAASTAKNNFWYGPNSIKKLLNARGVKPKAENVREMIVQLPNGSSIFGYSGDAPGNIAGQNLSAAYVDEIGKHKYPNEVWEELLAVRSGRAKVLISTTPTGKVFSLMKQIIATPGTKLVSGSSLTNLANLPGFENRLKAYKKGSKHWRQDVLGELVDFAGALFSNEMFVVPEFKVPLKDLDRIVIGVDPATGGNSEDAGETGIVVCGKKNDPSNPRAPNFYLIDDLSKKCTPNEVVQTVIKAYKKYGASTLVVEGNQGGQWVESLIKNEAPNIRIKMVSAQKSKGARAEEVVAFYEQGRLFHREHFSELETQMVEFDPDSPRNRKGSSPDRLDAFVHAIHELAEKSVQTLGFSNLALW